MRKKNPKLGNQEVSRSYGNLFLQEDDLDFEVSRSAGQQVTKSGSRGSSDVRSSLLEAVFVRVSVRRLDVCLCPSNCCG